MTIDDILGISSPEDFDRAAMEVFRRQAAECAPYREYLRLIGTEASGVAGVERIPFLPIELFKTHRVYCADCGEPEALFTSSATGGEGPSRHYISRLDDYDRTCTRGFELFYGPAGGVSLYALLPSYLEREGSSLVRMADGLIRRGRGGGFYLRDHARLLAEMAADWGPKILLGVSYALLDLAEEIAARGEKLPAGTTVMETGGMKGRRGEMPVERMHAILGEAFGVTDIHSEYGMAELMSQAYSAGGGVFRTPPWMRVAVRSLADPFDVRYAGDGGSRGGLNIADLANLHSCAFVQTQDVGRVAADGSFTLHGRVARSDIRGCNLLVQ
ncbi:MAG: acyltransferase [Alistipes sp.]|jgi:hypothetical protein|nr:acyltransferase [Alistipes sp.]